MSKASIIIPTQNRVTYLVDTLRSIQDQQNSSTDFEVLVIDNASTDDTPNRVEKLRSQMEYPLRYVREEKIGLHHSRHTGAREAVGEILVYIDDDIKAAQGWLSSHMAAYSDPKVRAAGGRVMPLWESVQPEWVRSLPPDYLSLLDYGEQPRPIIKGEGINGCNYSIRRTTLIDRGGFHPDSFSDPSLRWLRGDGEAGLTKKILASEGIIVYLPDAMVWHRIPQDRLNREYFKRRAEAHGIENGYTFARRWRCSFGSMVTLLMGGLLRSKWHSLQTGLFPKNSGERTRVEMQAYRFHALAQYARHLLQNPHLRQHVIRKSYMDITNASL